MEPPSIPVIKSKNYPKAEKYGMKIKLCRYPTLEKTYM